MQYQLLQADGIKICMRISGLSELRLRSSARIKSFTFDSLSSAISLGDSETERADTDFWCRNANYPLSMAARPVKTIFQQVETNDLVGSGFCTIIRVDERLKLNILPSFAGRRAMVEDISLVSEICSEFLRCKEIALRLEVLGGVMYPRFHVDHSAKDPSRVWKYSAVPCVRVVI